MGELPLDGPAPAIANAIEDAVGVPVDRVPALPETVLEAWERAGHA
jgi:CO/xanthine dehydrogenase Mo-binding subunit